MLAVYYRNNLYCVPSIWSFNLFVKRPIGIVLPRTREQLNCFIFILSLIHEHEFSSYIWEFEYHRVAFASVSFQSGCETKAVHTPSTTDVSACELWVSASLSSTVRIVTHTHTIIKTHTHTFKKHTHTHITQSLYHTHNHWKHTHCGCRWNPFLTNKSLALNLHLISEFIPPKCPACILHN